MDRMHRIFSALLHFVWVTLIEKSGRNGAELRLLRVKCSADVWPILPGVLFTKTHAKYQGVSPDSSVEQCAAGE
jgi:hypothetical protein